MDAGDGRFVTAETREALIGKFLEKNPHAKEIPHIFRVGDELEIHGSHFRITSIGNKFMQLRLLPRAELNSSALPNS